MKSKTIKKVINAKIEKWLETIDDKSVRDACARDFIVTGGSIASMLLGEKVNDYDIYFKRQETVKKVSDYYVAKINKIYKNKISSSKIEVVESNNIPMDKDPGSGPWETNKWKMFIEGMQRGEENRVKIYIPHIGYWRRSDVIQEEPIEDSFEPVYLTENAITLSDQIQLVIRFFGDADKIHENYDFAHATCYYHHEDGKRHLVLRAEAMEALLTKELIYIGSKYPLTSVIRSKKFILRGFTISAGTYLKILWQVAELDLKDPIVLQEQLIGVDIAYFSLLIDALRTVAPEKMTYNYISEIIDRVFSGEDDFDVDETQVNEIEDDLPI